MKKIALMMLVMGMANGVVRASEVRNENIIKFTPKVPKRLRDFHEKKAKFLYGPKVKAVIPASEIGIFEDAPEGYHKEGSYYVKKLPISERNEFYNQFIEGYEPKKEFEERMLVRRNPELMRELYGEEMSQKKINKRDAILASPEYQAKVAKEREWLLNVEKERISPINVEKGRISPTISMMPKREQSQSYWSQFVNWLWSVGQTSSSGSIEAPKNKAKKEYSITPFDPKRDTDSIENLFKKEESSLGQPPSYQYMLSCHDDPNCHIKVLRENNEFAGFIIYNADDKRINYLAIENNFRNKGYGKALLDDCIKELNNKGSDAIIRLVTTPGNLPALNLYEKAGFKRYKGTGYHTYDPTDILDSLFDHHVKAYQY